MITGEAMFKNRNQVIHILVALLALNWFDVWATNNSLQNGAEEANPIALYFIEDCGIIAILIIKTTFILPLFHNKVVDTIVQSTVCGIAIFSATTVYLILAIWHIVVFHIVGVI